MIFILKLGALPQGSSTGTHCTGSLVATRTGLNGCVEEKISTPHWASNPESTNP